MTINERFKEIIKRLYNGNKRAFSFKIGVSPTVIENVVGARNGNPSYEVIHKVCANANINPAWLILEKGEMLMEDDLDMVMEPNEIYHKTNPEEADYVLSLKETISVQKDLISVLKKQIDEPKTDKTEE
ncbi:MAG: XRE family transcriptional regulator [Paludibacteraceae bacterium]|nr:XRE family transcriptional regulator [Paludibacteraceae bacterium]